MNRQLLHKISLAAIFSLIAICSLGQDEEEGTPFVFDSLAFEKPPLKFITNLKELQAEIIDTILNPSGYLLRTRPERFRSVISIALKAKNGYIHLFLFLSDLSFTDSTY